MKKPVGIVEVKDSISALKGKMLLIRINKGRKRIIKYCGEIEDILPSLFTLKVSGEKKRDSIVVFVQRHYMRQRDFVREKIIVSYYATPHDII